MLRFLLIFFVGLLFSACISNSLIVNDIKEDPKELSTQTISKIAIPVREEGYSNFKTQTLKSQRELDKFIEKIKLQINWNKKKNFLETLLLKKIDFSEYNLFLYRINMTSGATVLSVDTPIGDKNNITIKIGQDQPNIGTANMAYYALAYKVAKSVKTITIDNGTEKTVIENKSLNTANSHHPVPDECMEWFDGCNDCGRVGKEGIPVCTEMACISYSEFKCKKWKE